MAVKDADGGDALGSVVDGRCDSIDELLKLLGGDIDRLLRVIEPYQQIADERLVELDAALRKGDAAQVRTIAEEMAMACYLVGQKEAGQRMEAISRARAKDVIDPVLVQCVARARAALLESIIHMEEEIARLRRGSAKQGAGAQE